ncbi:hypothetical protein BKA65DRAFT_85490 [Rhexocercosporidium sp. MPI-PUGE-AT-0058]|nr:hypothetical protein BKA65DRAFT_85490 [Rhexocercosporidium sp. MPI-PUGE-AT-0058]
MSLSLLSNELLSEIITYLDTALTSISLCSRQLHFITEPILYSNIHLNHPKSYTRFLRTIIAKPYLVGYVRHFRTKGHPYGWDYDLSFLTAEDQKWIRSQMSIAMHGKAACGKWFKMMFFKPNVNWTEVPMYWDAITAFLLTIFAPTIQTIRMDSYGSSFNHHPYIEYNYINMILNASNPAGSFQFQKLKEVTIKPSKVELIIPYLQIPSVTKFQASNLTLKHDLPKLAFNTTDLTLTGCRLLSRELMSLLSCFGSLRRLMYQDDGSGIFALVASHLRRGLGNSKGTLEELVLLQEEGENDRWSGDEGFLSSDGSGFATGSGSGSGSEPVEHRVLGSLQTFQKLKKLHVESKFLLPTKSWRNSSKAPYIYSNQDCLALADSFPPSLEHLTINISPSIYSELSELIATGIAMSCTPKLKSFRMSFRHSFAWNVKPMQVLVCRLENLREMMGEKGVEVTWNCMCEPLTPFGCYRDLIDL